MFVTQFYGYDVVVSDLLTRTERRQYRFPRSKKRRMRRKWEKQDKNYRSVQLFNAVHIGQTIYMSPASYKALKCKTK